MSQYWRAGIKDPQTNNVVLIYFSTENEYQYDEITDFLETEFGFYCVNCYLHRMNVVEYIANALTCHISTSRTCFNYKRSVVIG